MIGNEIYKFAKELWPFNRSITGDGLRDTLQRISEHLPALKIKAVPSGTKVFDWTVPKEWKIKEAYIITPKGKKICDFSQNNLHLVGYSIPFKGEVSFDELKKHLYTLPDQPNAIPYVTSYYEQRWGFCLSQEQLDSLENGTYKVLIDSSLFDGELNYGELLIKGKSDKEIFLSTYICHPSMANNELSGLTVVTFLSKWLQEIRNPNFSYRIIFIPETIGSITYLSQNYKEMKNKIFAGFNVTCVGDERAYSYVPSRNGYTISDLIAKHVLKWTDQNFIEYSWLDRGSDERQYCSPNVNLPVSCITRSKYGEYKEYHTSLDNLDFISPSGLAGAYKVYARVIELLEHNYAYKPILFCEPQLGKRDLYPTLGVRDRKDDFVQNMLNFLAYCDGALDLIEVADEIKVPAWELFEIINVLLENKLIERV